MSFRNFYSDNCCVMASHLNAIIAKFSWCYDCNNSTTCLLENVYCEKISLSLCSNHQFAYSCKIYSSLSIYIFI